MEKIKITLIIIAALAVGFGFGVSFGTGWTLDKCAEQGMKFLKINNMELEINKELIKIGMLRYFGENYNYAPLLNYTGS